MPELITLTVDGVATTVEPGTTGTDLYSLGARTSSSSASTASCATCDLPLADGAVVEAVTIDSPDGLAVLRHSTAHVLAQAVQEVNPEAQLGIGPPITDGFYYDFDVETPFTPEDLKADREGDAAHRQGGPALPSAGSSPRTRRATSWRTSRTSSSSSGSRATPGAEDGASVEVGAAS